MRIGKRVMPDDRRIFQDHADRSWFEVLVDRVGPWLVFIVGLSIVVLGYDLKAVSEHSNFSAFFNASSLLVAGVGTAASLCLVFLTYRVLMQTVRALDEAISLRRSGQHIDLASRHPLVFVEFASCCIDAQTVWREDEARDGKMATYESQETVATVRLKLRNASDSPALAVTSRATARTWYFEDGMVDFHPFVTHQPDQYCEISTITNYRAVLAPNDSTDVSFSWSNFMMPDRPAMSKNEYDSIEKSSRAIYAPVALEVETTFLGVIPDLAQPSLIRQIFYLSEGKLVAEDVMEFVLSVPEDVPAHRAIRLKPRFGTAGLADSSVFEEAQRKWIEMPFAHILTSVPRDGFLAALEELQRVQTVPDLRRALRPFDFHPRATDGLTDDQARELAEGLCARLRFFREHGEFSTQQACGSP